VKKEEKGTRSLHGIVYFRKRKHSRFNVDLPIEYARSDLAVYLGEAIHASEGGLFVNSPEKMGVGQHLPLKLFFSSGFEFNTIERPVRAVWVDVHLGEDWGGIIELG
jgi:hypothetical protein